MDKKQYDVETLKLLKQCQKFKELLTANIQYDIILKDNRIVLPTIFNRTAVKLAHVGHQSMQKAKAMMRSKVFFIGMDKVIEDEINNCIACQSTGWPTLPAKIQPSFLPNEVCDTLNTDVLGHYLPLWINDLDLHLLQLTPVLQQITLSKHFTSYLVVMVTLEKSLAIMGHRLNQNK